MFFLGGSIGFTKSFFSAVLLTFTVILGVFMTFIVSKILSMTILKGMPSNFTLELPPYRKPQVLKTLVRSIFDRILVVLGRAVLVAIPAGVLIWIMANININGQTALYYVTDFLNPFARLMGLDGVILMAFILGFPANEIVIPIIIMTYMKANSLMELENLNQLKVLFIDNGWTMNTAICTILFTLFHWPCSTTCITIKKETGSIKWTVASFLIPTMVGVLMCMVVTLIFKIFSF